MLWLNPDVVAGAFMLSREFMVQVLDMTLANPVPFWRVPN